MKLQINSILQNKEPSYQTKIESLLNLKELPHLLKVNFAYQAAESVFHLINEVEEPMAYKAAQNCLNLLKDYLANPTESKIEGLKKAANTIYAIAESAEDVNCITTDTNSIDSAYATAYAALTATSSDEIAIDAASFAVESAASNTKEFKALYFKLVLLLNKEYNLGFDSELLGGLYL